jgi:hypothetical protein
MLFFARGVFYLEDGGDTFLRNVASYKTQTTPHPRRQQSLESSLKNLKSYNKEVLPKQLALWVCVKNFNFQSTQRVEHHLSPDFEA